MFSKFQNVQMHVTWILASWKKYFRDVLSVSSPSDTSWNITRCCVYNLPHYQSREAGYICTCKVPRCVQVFIRTNDLFQLFAARCLHVSQKMVHHSKMGLLDKLGCLALCPRFAEMYMYKIRWSFHWQV